MNPFHPSTLPPFHPSIRTGPHSGTVLMEAVLCLPLLLFLVTGIVQFARLWEAKLLTKHAAYNAARAALVSNDADYGYRDPRGRIVFNTHGGAVWLAAVNTLAWKSATFSTKGDGADYGFPGFEGDSGFRADSSAFIRDQVRVVSSQSWESNGMVRVTVAFRFPLLFSVFALGSVQGHEDGDDDLRPLVHDTALDTRPRSSWDAGIPHFRLVESCVMPKPWSTRFYPRVGANEARHMEMEAP